MSEIGFVSNLNGDLFRSPIFISDTAFDPTHLLRRLGHSPYIRVIILSKPTKLFSSSKNTPQDESDEHIITRHNTAVKSFK